MALENPMQTTHSFSTPSHLSVFHCFLLLMASLFVVPAHAQGQIFRCGTEYTNNPTPEQKKTCVALDGGNVTVIQAPKPRVAAGKPTAVTSSAPAPVPSSSDHPKVDPNVQKARDSDARAILEAELRRGEQRLAELQHEYNGGQPERRGEEVRNQLRYGERVAALKDSIARAEADLVGIRRELDRATQQKR